MPEPAKALKPLPLLVSEIERGSPLKSCQQIIVVGNSKTDLAPTWHRGPYFFNRTPSPPSRGIVRVRDVVMIEAGGIRWPYHTA